MNSNLSLSISRIARGDAVALAELYDRTSRLVFGLAYRILRRPDEAEEVVVDVYTQVWRTASRFDARRGSVEAWLSMIARCRAIDRRRSRVSRPDVGTVTVDPLDLTDIVEPDDFLSALDARQRLESTLGTLTTHERELVTLAFYEGYTQVELADRFRLPLGTIKTRIRAALAKLREALQDRGVLTTPSEAGR